MSAAKPSPMPGRFGARTRWWSKVYRWATAGVGAQGQDINHAGRLHIAARPSQALVLREGVDGGVLRGHHAQRGNADVRKRMPLARGRLHALSAATSREGPGRCSTRRAEQFPCAGLDRHQMCMRPHRRLRQEDYRAGDQDFPAHAARPTSVKQGAREAAAALRTRCWRVHCDLTSAGVQLHAGRHLTRAAERIRAALGRPVAPHEGARAQFGGRVPAPAARHGADRLGPHPAGHARSVAHACRACRTRAASAWRQGVVRIAAAPRRAAVMPQARHRCHAPPRLRPTAGNQRRRAHAVTRVSPRHYESAHGGLALPAMHTPRTGWCGGAAPPALPRGPCAAGGCPAYDVSASQGSASRHARALAWGAHMRRMRSTWAASTA